MKHNTTITISTVAFAVACGLVPKIETTEFNDEGDACLVKAGNSPFADPAELTPDDDLAIMVFFPAGCLSSSCSTVIDASCSASVEGDRIVVTSSGTLEEDVSPRRACTDDCGLMTAECQLPDLAEGTYTIVHGDSEQTVNLPGSPECAGAQF